MSTNKKKSKSRVLANRYQVLKKLGKGNFGTAYLCKDLRVKSADSDEGLKVLKEISVGDLQPDETVDAMHEARLLSKLDHPSIVQFHDSFIDGEFFCIVTEYCEGGDLDMLIQEFKKSKKQFDEKTVLDWFVQLLLAVHYMHSRRVLHRDLKTRNIFLKKNMVKIGDFGISRILMGTSDLASTFTGTPYYMSPEVLKHEGYNSKSDVWSIGCILYEMCSLDHAFDGKSLMAVMYKIVEGEPPDLPQKYSQELNRVLKLMLSKDPEKRPTATELIKIPLISNHIAKMSEEYKIKHSINESNHASSDAAAIAKALKERSRLDDLRKTEDNIKWKNLPPRERMRLKKMQQADKEAKRLSEVARVQLIENQQRKEAIQQTLFKPSVPAWQGGSGEGIDLKSALTVRAMDTKPRKDFGTRSAPMVLYDENKSSSEDEQQDTIKYRPLKTAGGPTLYQYLPHVASDIDDRPITPLRDKMVYDKVFSSLDFKDGIPENPALANTYYSQFDEDFTPSDDDDDDDDEAGETVVPKKGGGSGDDDDDILFGSSDGTLKKDDEDELYNHLQYVLDKDNDTEGTLTLADDIEAGAFGPVAREAKIKNLRAECEKMLGHEAFEKAYNYLKTARYMRANETTTEEDIMQGLRDFVKNPSDCFLGDQLLFLEEQHGTASL